MPATERSKYSQNLFSTIAQRREKIRILESADIIVMRYLFVMLE